MSSEEILHQFFLAGLDADENTRAPILLEAGQCDPTFPPRLRAMWANTHLDDSRFFNGLSRYIPHEPSFPRDVGVYRLEEKIGAGGMGVVFRAWQSDLERLVAVKFLTHRGLASGADHFAQEARILAKMNHANIVTIFETGHLDIGDRVFPYVVMPLCKGLALDAYFRKHAPNLKERLHLLLQATEGLGHAHAQFINHRDLKPSNLLVEETDAGPILKIIDFGLAGSQDERLRGGTDGFLAPEAKSGATLTGATADIYALGVILHLLLADAPPRENQSCSQVASNGGPLAIPSRKLRGDLDAVCAKAMAADPNQRYQTVQDLAADLRAFLTVKPLQAVRPTHRYLVTKFVVRRKTQLTIALLALMILTGWAQSLRQKIASDRKAVEQERALLRSERQKLKVHDTLVAMFANLNPGRGGLQISVRELVMRGEAQLEKADYGNDPGLKGAAYLAMANVYEEIGMFRHALRLSERAGEIFECEDEVGRVDYLSALRHQAFQLSRLGHLKPARALYEKLIDDPQTGQDPEFLLMVQTGLGIVYVAEREADAALKVLEPAHQAWRTLKGANHTRTLAAQDTLARALILKNNSRRARTLLTDVHQKLSTQLGPDHPRTLAALSNLALADVDEEDADEQLLRDVVARQSRILGGGHPDTLYSKNLLGSYLYQQKRYGEAADQLECALLAVETDDWESRFLLAHNLGNTLKDMGEVARAEALLVEAGDGRTKLLGEEHPQTFLSLGTLVEIYIKSGREHAALVQAEDLYQKVVMRWGPHGGIAPLFHQLLREAERAAAAKRQRSMNAAAFPQGGATR